MDNGCVPKLYDNCSQLAYKVARSDKIGNTLDNRPVAGRLSVTLPQRRQPARWCQKS